MNVRRCKDCGKYKYLPDKGKCRDCLDASQITVEINAHKVKDSSLVYSDTLTVEGSDLKGNWSKLDDYEKKTSPSWIKAIVKHHRKKMTEVVVDVDRNSFKQIHRSRSPISHSPSNKSFISATQAEVEKMKRILTQ
jgi:hypothetical protein